MKALRIPCFVLLALLILSLANSVAMTRHCAAWQETLDAADEAAARSDWPEAIAQLNRLRDDWTPCRAWLRITVSHNTVDEAESLLDQAVLLSRLEEPTHMRAALADLRALLRQMAEGEQLSLANIL